MSDSWEIERRYLVRVNEELWDGLGQGRRYRQGYVRSGNPAVRIRVGEPRGAVLTVKSGEGVRRREAETVVPPEVAEALLAASERRVVLKTRWDVGPWELDRFEGPLEGLTLLEIELEHEGDSVPPPPLGIRILTEVTYDNRFTSSHLATLSPEGQAALVSQVYGEVGGR
ncbi:MAG: adenylate cyclase [Gemmatimonadota bacterium]|jgi:adenylate cyclase